MKRLLLTLILIAALILPSNAFAACFGFSDEEMPKVVADYVCPFGAIQARVVGVSEVGGTQYALLQVAAQGEIVGLAIHEIESNGDLGRIVYFQKADGTTLLDRRQPNENKGQPG